jgi:molybdopterin synthase sulfur carrier subunit
MMKVKILAFGVAKDIFGSSSIDLNIDREPTISALRSLLEESYPRLKKLASYLVAVNNEYASANQLISDVDEIAIIPPVSGG